MLKRLIGINKEEPINWLKFAFWTIILGIFVAAPVTLLVIHILTFWIKNETLIFLLAGGSAGMILGLIISAIIKKRVRG